MWARFKAYPLQVSAGCCTPTYMVIQAYIYQHHVKLGQVFLFCLFKTSSGSMPSFRFQITNVLMCFRSIWKICSTISYYLIWNQTECLHLKCFSTDTKSGTIFSLSTVMLFHVTLSSFDISGPRKTCMCYGDSYSILYT